MSTQRDDPRSTRSTVSLVGGIALVMIGLGQAIYQISSGLPDGSSWLQLFVGTVQFIWGAAVAGDVIRRRRRTPRAEARDR